MATRAKALGAIGGTSNNANTNTTDSAQPNKMPVIGNKAPFGRDGKENSMPGANGNHNNNNNNQSKNVDSVKDWDDLDAEDNGDPLMVSEYVVEIVEYMRRIEVNMHVP